MCLTINWNKNGLQQHLNVSLFEEKKRTPSRKSLGVLNGLQNCIFKTKSHLTLPWL